MRRHRSVKRIFSSSSGTLTRLGSAAPSPWSARDRAARLLDLRPGGGGHGHALDGEAAPYVSHAEQLDRSTRPAYRPGLEQRLRGHLDAGGELAQIADVLHLRGLLEGVREAALRDPADERHLTALEAGSRLPARARRLPLAAPARSLADPGARPAPLADAGPVRPRRGSEAVQQEAFYRDGLGRGLGLPPRRRLRLGARPPSSRRLRLPFRRRHTVTCLPSPASPRRGGAPDRACRGARGDPSSPRHPGDA